MITNKDVFPHKFNGLLKRDAFVSALDQLQDSLLRAETSHKDLDLLVALRVCYMLLEDKVKSRPPKLPDFEEDKK